MSSENFSRMLIELEIFFLSKWGTEPLRQPHGRVQLEAKYFLQMTHNVPPVVEDIVSEVNASADSASPGLAGYFWS